MFKEIFLFDLKLNFRKIPTYIYFGVFFVISFLLGLNEAGVFDVARGDSNLLVNSAVAVAGVIINLGDNIFGLINSVILVSIMATAIQKDYQYNTHPLYFTKPINKASYFFGRFSSAFLTALFVFSAQVLGYLAGCLFGIGKPQMGEFSVMNFLEPFLIFTLPNVLLLGSIFFSLTTFTRNTLPAYLFCIVLLVITSITASVTADLNNKAAAAIWEPFGSQALRHLTQYWTPDDQNTRMIPLEGSLLYNRLLWLCIGVAITLISFFKFSFSQFLTPFTWFGKKDNEARSADETQAHSLALLPKSRQNFGVKASWRQLFYLARFEFVKMAKGPFFIVICLLGIVMMYIISRFMGAMYDTETYPVTYQILESAAGVFLFFIIILIVFLSGNLIWKEREQKMDEFTGTAPVSNGVLFFSKYLALIYVIATLLGVVILTGMGIQISTGYFNVQPLLYLESMLRTLVGFAIMAAACLFVQVLTPNKYLGFFLSLIPVLLVRIVFKFLEWNNDLYIFNSSGPSMPYSEMNGFGHTVASWFLYKAYWLSIMLVLCLLGLTIYARGKEKGIKARFNLSKSSFDAVHKFAVAFCFLFAIASGVFIYYNTNILHQYLTPKEQEKEMAAFEKKYKVFEKTAQLRIVESRLNVDIYPETRNVQANGFYWLKNKHQQPVDTLFINYEGGKKSAYSYSSLEPEQKGFKLISDDQKYGVKIFKLQQPVQPGDSIKFVFEMKYSPVGFENGYTETQMVYNGTFFNNSQFPSIGYNPAMELGSNTARKKYKLKPKPRMAAVDDAVARMNNYISNDADWIRFETTVSTAEDQIALAPGYLQKEWTKGGRRYFNYKMDSPILNFYAYLSARYEVKKDKWKGVNIEIYYQKGHEYNLDRMIKGIKRALDYYTLNFGPYQHRQVRILEFPRYASFAQSFPNTIPYSESVGFITKVEDNDPEKIDVPFYITAHEVGHQWWAHQVIGGNVQGSVLMSETMSQYSALMVMEKEYGKQAMKKFLKYEMDKYLQGRTFESKKEVPLMLCENQGYIHYNKGSVIMYAVKDYLGEEVLNKAIRTYLQKTKFQEPPYTNAVEFVNQIREATPDSLKYIIKDMFETITVYENYVKDLSYEKTKEGKYKVSLRVGSAKFRADSLGKSTRVPVADYIDIGVFSSQMVKGKQQAKELFLKRIKMDEPEKTFTLLVDEKPESAGIDPYHKLIDRTPDNNSWKFGSKPPAVFIASDKPVKVQTKTKS
jgi:ABC-2 type transport system permease protein